VRLAGPNSGVVAKARMRVKRAGPDDWLEMEVVASDRPRMTVEESVGAKGRRRTRGTSAEEPPTGATKVTFEPAWQKTPAVERLAGPFTRVVVRRANRKSLERLADALASAGSKPHREREEPR
jgi:hypothetical protein